jgi:hypothetical protein
MAMATNEGQELMSGSNVRNIDISALNEIEGVDKEKVLAFFNSEANISSLNFILDAVKRNCQNIV